MRSIAAVMLAVIVGGSIASAQAQDGSDARSTFLQRFATANTTHDGCLTRQQAIAGHIKAVVRDFDAIDTARRGCVTADQVIAFRSKVAHNFATANVTHDGCLTEQQAIDGGLRRVAKEFDKIDVAHRGCITLNQVRTYLAQNPRTFKIMQTGHGVK